ncbi:MAG TPA: hypothetical protein P5300_03805 [Acidobacteriota bacterium]|nr:hypothetical protein [Acidobacteriota bacterium]
MGTYELLTREVRRHGGFWCLLTVSFVFLAVVDVYSRPDVEAWIWRLLGLVLTPMLLAKAAIVEERGSGELRRWRDQVGDSVSVARAKIFFLTLAVALTGLLVLPAGWLAQQIWGNLESSQSVGGLMWIWITAVLASVAQAGTALVWDVRWRWAVPSLIFLGVVAATDLLWTRGEALGGWTKIQPAAALGTVAVFGALAVVGYRLAIRSLDEGLRAERQEEPIQLKLGQSNTHASHRCQ